MKKRELFCCVIWMMAVAVSACVESSSIQKIEDNTCDPDCATYGGGRGQICVSLNHQNICKPQCLGDKVGENKACWKNASLGPAAPTLAIVDTCVSDDNGLLYSASSTSQE